MMLTRLKYVDAFSDGRLLEVIGNWSVTLVYIAMTKGLSNSPRNNQADAQL